jgi:hypothetical protein
MTPQQLEQTIAETEALLACLPDEDWTVHEHTFDVFFGHTEYYVRFGYGEDSTVMRKWQADFVAASPRLLRRLVAACRSREQT